MRPLPAAGLDVLAVLVFVVAGRRTHAEGLDVAGTAATAWPFLVALAAGWVTARAWVAPSAVLRTGLPVWLVTVVVGLLLRRVAGEGTAPAFVVVASLVLAALLLGWRAVARRSLFPGARQASEARPASGSGVAGRRDGE